MTTTTPETAAPTSETWQQFTESLTEWEKLLSGRQTKRDTFQEQRDSEKEAGDNAEAERALCERAELFLRSEIKERRRKTTEAIAGLGSTALEQIYGEGYSMRFVETGDAENAANLKLEIEILSRIDNEEIATGLLGERGGGVVEVVAFALRIAALGWRRYDGPMLLDEAYKSMSADGKIGRVAEFLDRVTEETGRQLLFATHKADVFTGVARNVVRVTQAGDGARAERLSPDQRAELVSQETDDPALLAP
jgi:hypothetical protein